jgi:hypothetical protein
MLFIYRQPRSPLSLAESLPEATEDPAALPEGAVVEVAT